MIGQGSAEPGCCLSNPAFHQPCLNQSVSTVARKQSPFLLEYLYRISDSRIRKMFRIFSNNKNSFNNQNSFNQSTIINNISDDESKIHEWLSPLDPRVRHQDIRSQRMDGVGTWLLETREFRSWHSGGEEDESFHATLFCDGSPGVGKSYIR